MPDLPRVRAEPLIARAKVVKGDMQLARRKNQANYLSGSARVEDEFETTIPGLSFEIEVKMPALLDVCRNTVSLYLLEGGVKWRVYQIEVQPSTKRSHNSAAGALYGQHEHRGDEALPLNRYTLDCSTTVSELASVFCKEANLAFKGSVLMP